MSEIICSLQQFVTLLQSIQEQSSTKCQIKLLNNEHILDDVNDSNYNYNEPKTGLLFHVNLYFKSVRGIAFMPITKIVNFQADTAVFYIEVADVLKKLSPLIKLAKSDNLTLKLNQDTIETCILIGNSDVNVSEINLCFDGDSIDEVDYAQLMTTPKIKLTFPPQMFTTQFTKCDENELITIKIGILNKSERVLYISNEQKQSTLFKRKILSNILNVVVDEGQEEQDKKKSVKIENVDEEEEEIIKQDEQRKKLKLDMKMKINENIQLSRLFKHNLENPDFNLEVDLKIGAKVWIALLSKVQNNLAENPKVYFNEELIHLLLHLKHSSFIHYIMVPHFDEE